MKVCLFVLFVALVICVYVCWSWHVCVITVVPLVAGFRAVLFLESCLCCLWLYFGALVLCVPLMSRFIFCGLGSRVQWFKIEAWIITDRFLGLACYKYTCICPALANTLFSSSRAHYWGLGGVSELLQTTLTLWYRCFAVRGLGSCGSLFNTPGLWSFDAGSLLAAFLLAVVTLIEP